MKYSSSLAKEEREKIFDLFVVNKKLKFSEIEKKLNIRSNMISYHLDQMLREDILEKKDKSYFLTKDAEKYLPIISHMVGREMSPLPVVLVGLINNKKILLIQRNKRPYKNYWSLIGGKIKLEESIQDAAKRHIVEKTRIVPEFKSVNSILHERVVENEDIKHGFILFFVEMKTNELKFLESIHGSLKWVDLIDIDRENIIPSDLWLIKNKLNKKIDYNSAKMFEVEDELKELRFDD